MMTGAIRVLDIFVKLCNPAKLLCNFLYNSKKIARDFFWFF